MIQSTNWIWQLQQWCILGTSSPWETNKNIFEEKLIELNLFWKSWQCHLHCSSLMFLFLLCQIEGIKNYSAEAQRLCFHIIPLPNHSPCAQNKSLNSYFSSHFKTHLTGKSSPFIAVIFFEPDCNFSLQSSFSHNRLIQSLSVLGW